jgi:uncharacterized CHY-type Zn-finger protein
MTQITDMNWTPRGLTYTIQCACRQIMTVPIFAGRVTCPFCRREYNVNRLAREWAERDNRCPA